MSTSARVSSLNYPAEAQPQAFYETVCRCRQPEELFGDLGQTPAQQLKHLELCFKHLIKTYHPDRFATRTPDCQYATQISQIVIAQRQMARQKIDAGHYGKIPAAPARPYTSRVRTDQRDYYVTAHLVAGEFADLYRAYYGEAPGQTQDVVIKVMAEAAQNTLAENEIRFYQTRPEPLPPAWLDSFKAPGTGKQALILSYLAGGYDLIMLKEKYTQAHRVDGLPPEHVVWILERFLLQLGWLHSQHILHGDIQPDNLIVQPATHQGHLVDYLHCLIQPERTDRLAVVNPAFCAPETLTGRHTPHPAAELYALGKCMIYLLGGDPRRDSLPAHVPPQFNAFLQKFVQPDSARRADDAWEQVEALAHLREQLFGARHQFLPLSL